MTKKLNRRDLLKLMGLSGSSALASGAPLAALIEAMLSGMVQKAEAASSGLNPRRYLYIQQPGAPSRWMFDLFLDPLKTGSFTVNPHMGTKYVATGGRYTEVSYETIDRTINGRNLRLPWLWQYEVPKSGGGTRPMTELLNNLLWIGGMNTANAGHPGSQAMHITPLGAKQSLVALSADHSSAPIAAINAGASSYKFKSEKGKSAVSVGGTGNLISTLLTPFNESGLDSYFSKRATVQSEIDNVVNVLNEYAKARVPQSASLAEAYEGAKNIILNGVGDFESYWTEALARYKDLVTRAIDPTQVLPGINDLPIGTTGARDKKYNFAGTIVTNADLRSMIQNDSYINNLAEHFAFSEYVITKNLSYSVTISPRAMSKLLVNDQELSLGFDEHDSGKMIVLYINSMYSRAMASCLLELFDKLKAESLFNETLINLGSEFNRSPRADGSGSDHGFQASSVSLFCGDIQGPKFVGNQMDYPDPSSTYRGFWGYGASVNLLGSELSVGNLASTIAAILRVPSPVTASTSLVDSNINLICEETKKVG